VNRFKLHVDKILLALIFIVLMTATIRWTLSDRTPPAWDPADHISAGYDYYAPLARLDFKEFFREFFIYPHYYAPFVHLCTASMMLIFGASKLTGIGVNFLSLAVLLYTVNWISRFLYGKPVDSGTNRRTSLIIPGVLAALLASCYHFSAWLIHDGFLDYPLMVMATVGFALLLKADLFENRKDALYFGLAAGLGMLTKQTYVFFFILPALFVTVRVLLTKNPRAIINLILSGLTIIAVSAIWYAPHLTEVLAIYRENQLAAAREHEAPLFSFMSNMFYVHGLLSPQIQVPFAILLVLGVVYTLIRRRKQSLVLYLWILSGIGMFTMVANKDLRYTVPILPAVAVLSTAWLYEVRFNLENKLSFALKLAPVALIAGWALVSFFNAQFPADGQSSYIINTPKFQWMVYGRNYFGFDHRPLQNDWSIPEVVQTLEQDWRDHPPVVHQPNRDRQTPDETFSPSTIKVSDSLETPTLGVVVNSPFLNPSNVALYARLLARGRGAPALFKVEWLTAEAARDRFKECDYLLIRTGLNKADWVAPLERYAESLINESPSRFSRIAAFSIPFVEAESVLYRRVQ
jgi:4-amino-4-deoxy-L-arabinose transferase-like glycosyltransferase